MINTYFISGHMDLTREEFKEHYEEKLLSLIFNERARFVVGDCAGADAYAQEFLRDNGVTEERVNVYYAFKKMRNNIGDWNSIGGFRSYEEKDGCMTANSDFDVCWVRPGKENSGTSRNLFRRLDLAFKENDKITMQVVLIQLEEQIFKFRGK